MKLQSLPTFLVRRKNWLLMAALALSLTAALLLRPSSPQAQRVTLPPNQAHRPWRRSVSAETAPISAT